VAISFWLSAAGVRFQRISVAHQANLLIYTAGTQSGAPLNSARLHTSLTRGEGDISFTYQRIENSGHRRTNGFLVPRGRSLDMSLYLEAEYAFTNLSVVKSS
jgi:hypothetical protein